METKVCSHCRVEKPLSEFHLSSSRKDGHAYWCKPCAIAAIVASHRKNPKKHCATVSKYYHAKGWETLLEKKYGLPRGGYKQMLDAQGGVCAVCGNPPDGKGRLHVDHDHTTGVIRGLLCYSCNTILGKLNDSPERLAQLLTYLTKGYKPALVPVKALV